MHVKTLTRRGLLAATAAAAALGAAQPALAATGGAVYALSNETQNAVLTFDRAADGTLHQHGGPSPAAQVRTPGWARRARWCAATASSAVNAGSNSVSIFRTGRHGLRLVDVQPSGGTQPVSLSIRNRLVYVLNAGDGGNVSGFRALRGTAT